MGIETLNSERTRVVFLHGREGRKDQGRKATWLKERFGAVVPRLPTEYLNASLELARAVVSQERPEVVVGSSFGGAVLAALVQEGHWRGPCVFLAQAGVKLGVMTAFPDDVPAVFVHGLRDDVVDPADSRSLATASRSLLVEIDDDHRLGTVLTDGHLEQALARLGIATAPSHMDSAGSE